MGSLVISARFCGPPNSGNGGYAAGLVAEQIAGAAEVTLRSPPPLAQALELERAEGEQGVRLMHAGKLVVEGRPTRLVLDVPPAPSFEEASARVQYYAGFTESLFPGCFVCGRERAEGDGLRIFAGRCAGDVLVMAPWLPHASLADAEGRIAPRMVWAALDCPGYFAAAPGKAALLGRIAAEVSVLPSPGERCVVIGWKLGSEGRKIHAGTALFGASGALYGCARSTWIELA